MSGGGFLSGRRSARYLLFFGLSLWALGAAQAALFEDDEARKAILDLRQRVELIRNDAEQSKKRLADENTILTKGLFELQRQNELLRGEIATMRGQLEQQAKDLSDGQRSAKDQLGQLTERVTRLEPSKVSVDGVEFLADPVEKRAFDSALAVFKKGDFGAAQSLFAGFINRYPSSTYLAPALFWLGNAQYATRDYKEAIVNFRALIARSPDHARAPEAVLSVANCQLELKDIKAAKKTLTDLLKAYPDSEAAAAAKERLAALK